MVPWLPRRYFWGLQNREFTDTIYGNGLSTAHRFLFRCILTGVLRVVVIQPALSV